jgi:hypothetical protein
MAEMITVTSRLNLPQRDIFIWAVVIFFSNYLVELVKGTWQSSLSDTISGLCTVDVFQYMGWYAIFRLLGASDVIPMARRKDVLIITAFCLLVFLPADKMIWVAATGVAVYMMFCSRDDLRLRAAGIVLAALSVQEFWGHILFQLISMPLLRAETAVVGTILQLTRRGVMWYDNIITTSSSHGIVLYPYCSSFHNVSLALLCWLTLTKLRHLKWRGYDLIWGGLTAGTVILLNTMRLYFMALNVDYYNFWHEGAGSEIFAVGTSVSVISLTLYGSGRVMRQL